MCCECTVSGVVCLLWGTDLWPRTSWQMPTVQDPRKMWLATRSLLTVWWKMLVSGAEIGAVPCLLALAVACLSASGGVRGLYAAGYLSFGICSILCSVSRPGCPLELFLGKFSFFILSGDPTVWLLSHVSPLRLSSGHSRPVLTLSTNDAARASLSSP